MNKHASYDAIAAWYDATVRKADFVGDEVLPHLFALVGDAGGRAVCDLACGQGRVARELARRGAVVTAIDLSATLIQIAQHHEHAHPSGITYAVDDAEHLAMVNDAAFDGVVCNLALMDIADLDAVFATVGRVLRPGGWFVFSITHPCFQTPHATTQIDPDGTASHLTLSYFEERHWVSRNAEGVRGKVGAQHRTLATYLNVLARGFVLEQIVEPRRNTNTAIVPGFLLVRCAKR